MMDVDICGEEILRLAQEGLTERAKFKRWEEAWQGEEAVRRLELGGKSGGSWDRWGVTFGDRIGPRSRKT